MVVTLSLGMDDKHILMLLSKADAIASENDRVVSVPKINTDDGTRIAELERMIVELQSKLARKETLCNDLTIRLEKLLSSRGVGVVAVNYDVSKDTLIQQEKSYDHLPRFKTNTGTGAPPCVTAIFDSLAPKITYAYEMDKRRTAFTKSECLQLVEPVRAEWEIKVPPEIVNSLSGSKVYKSNGALKDDFQGVDAQPVHLLAYVVCKLYNRAAMVLQEVKRKDSFINLNKVATEKPTSSVPEDAPTGVPENIKTKWFDNPELLPYLSKARSTVHHSFAFPSASSCETAVSLSVRKLMTKPKLEECLEQLASIIAIMEFAATKSWRLDGTLVD